MEVILLVEEEDEEDDLDDLEEEDDEVDSVSESIFSFGITIFLALLIIVSYSFVLGEGGSLEVSSNG